MNYLKVTSVSLAKNRIEVKFEPKGTISQYFIPPYSQYAEYSVDVTGVPVGVGLIPFVCNVLPIIWLTDAELLLPELDMDFYNSISEFKRGYRQMYPMFDFKGKIKVGKLIDNRPDRVQGSATLFSGGVDAFCTLLSHIEETPALVTLWGADVKLTDTEGWNVVNDHIHKTGGDFGLGVNSVKTNFRQILNIVTLSRLVKPSGDNYWHGFQHGIGIISHAAPLAWINGWATVYIASSYHISARGQYTCASDPTIDSFVRFCGCKVNHDGYELTRQMKIQRICEMSDSHKIRPYLRVCWKSTGGHNCCQCEKCIRTICEILAEGRNPKEYGFDFHDADMKNARKIVLLDYSRTISPAWKEIQLNMQKLPADQVPEWAQWIIGCDFETEAKRADIASIKRKRKLKNLPRHIAGKILRVLHLR